jgi:uncharacterized membrane protein YbhN (UPF0104 family)
MARAARALPPALGAASGEAELIKAFARSGPTPVPPPDLRRGGARRADSGSLPARLLTIAALIAALVSLLLAVPGLHSIASEIGHLSVGWLVLAATLELASCTSFVVVFRHFFTGVPARGARELAWTEMGSGALLPGGGVGSLAVGGWLLHLAGMPARKVVRNSSGLFFLTSAVNVAALIGGGLLLASGLSAGRHDLLRAGLPILAGSLAVGTVLTTARLSRRRSAVSADSTWAAQLVGGVGAAEHALRHPSWRLAGAVGYLGFDIAVLWATLSGVGYSPPLAVLVLGYIIGYLANLIPIPGAVGVLEGGLAGTLVLYGAPVTEATAGVLVYHAIAFWIPSIGGLLGYRRLRRHLATDMALAGATDERIPAQALSRTAFLTHPPLPAPGEPMQKPVTPHPPVSPVARGEPRAPSRSNLPRTALRPRDLEAHAVRWLRSLRDKEPVRPASADAERTC